MACDNEEFNYAGNAAEYLISSGLAGKLSETSKNMFVSYAKEFKLNPYRRELHCINIKSDGECQICVGYGVYLRRAEATGNLNGWKSWVEGTDDTMKASVEIYRKDWAHPFVHEVYLKEAAPVNEDGTVPAFWEKMPKFQLRKVAISQGFRLCFSDELGGMPYELSELCQCEDSVPPVAVKQEIVNPVPDKKAMNSEDTPINLKVVTPSMDELDRYLEDNKVFFTDKHIAWIKGKLAKDSGTQQVSKMLSYAKKVVRGEAGNNSSGRRYYIPNAGNLTPSPVY